MGGTHQDTGMKTSMTLSQLAVMRFFAATLLVRCASDASFLLGWKRRSLSGRRTGVFSSPLL